MQNIKYVIQNIAKYKMCNLKQRRTCALSVSVISSAWWMLFSTSEWSLLWKIFSAVMKMKVWMMKIRRITVSIVTVWPFSKLKLELELHAHLYRSARAEWAGLVNCSRARASVWDYYYSGIIVANKRENPWDWTVTGCRCRHNTHTCRRQTHLSACTCVRTHCNNNMRAIYTAKQHFITIHSYINKRQPN